MMKRNLLVSAIVLMMSIGAATAQNYKTALGVKFYPGAVTLKHFISNKTALEGIGYFWNKGSRITGLYEIHSNIASVANLSWYIGPGAHIGFYSSKYGGGSSIGIDGVLGLDFKIPSAPINLSVDWQPSFEFGNNYGNGFSGNWGGLAIRYVF
jgi:hypothetical protein